MLTNEYLLQILYSLSGEGTFVKLYQQLSQPHLSGGAKWKNLLDVPFLPDFFLLSPIFFQIFHLFPNLFRFPPLIFPPIFRCQGGGGHFAFLALLLATLLSYTHSLAK